MSKVFSSTDGQVPSKLVKIWILLYGQHKIEINLTETEKEVPRKCKEVTFSMENTTPAKGHIKLVQQSFSREIKKVSCFFSSLLGPPLPWQTFSTFEAACPAITRLICNREHQTRQKKRYLQQFLYRRECICSFHLGKVLKSVFRFLLLTKGRCTCHQIWMSLYSLC